MANEYTFKFIPVDADISKICVDQTRFKQIIINLLTNSVNYNNKNG